MEDNVKTKSLDGIEQKLQHMDAGTLRYHVLESAKNFKTSWIELGRSLYSVWKDKLYKDWGYGSFDIYTAKEIGIRKPTAVKLLRSYYFLEKEEPQLLNKEHTHGLKPAQVPSYEAIDVLRQAKNKKTIDAEDYANLKRDIFEKAKDHREVKKDLTALIRQRQELEPEEAWEKRRSGTLRRFLGTLKALKQEAEISKILPAPLLKEVGDLIKKIEVQLG
ncbi:MAG: hypothetical protein NT033_08835 [Candidatus Omnitrophica bacterium]|nr:hypothetical protein [Candidatus Omnitrophota bacterium]